MAGNFNIRPDRRSGPLLASAIVLFLGALGVAIVVTASGQNPYQALLVFVVFAAVVPVLALLLRATPQRTLHSLYSWIRSRKEMESRIYQPRAVRTKVRYGTNLPPSAADVKDLKGGTSNWVPSNVPPRKREP